MIHKEDILIYLKANKDFFLEKYGIVKVGIFDSFARNEQTEESDIDILIEMQPGTENIFEKRLQMKELLSKEFSRPADVCHSKAIKPIFRDLIFKDAVYA